MLPAPGSGRTACRHPPGVTPGWSLGPIATMAASSIYAAPPLFSVPRPQWGRVAGSFLMMCVSADPKPQILGEAETKKRRRGWMFRGSRWRCTDSCSTRSPNGGFGSPNATSPSENCWTGGPANRPAAPKRHGKRQTGLEQWCTTALLTLQQHSSVVCSPPPCARQTAPGRPRSSTCRSSGSPTLHDVRTCYDDNCRILIIA